MRVRISFDALRLCLLVAAGVTSGYLWRAAFESSSPVDQRTAATPRLVEPAPAPPIVRIVPHHLTTTHRPAVVRHVVRRPVAHTTHHLPATLISSHPAASPRPVATPAAPAPKSPPPAPKPSPAPTPAPPTTTSVTPPVAAPVQQAAPPPATTTAPPAPPSPPPTTSDDTSRPGWGKGDKNHDHDGPGGKKP